MKLRDENNNRIYGLSIVFREAIFSLIFVVVIIKVVLARLGRQGSLEPSPAFDIKREGIIYTVGNQTATIKFSLDNQEPGYVGFICTKISEPVIDNFIKTMGFKDNQYQKEVVDPQNIDENRTKTQLLYKWMKGQGLGKSKIVIDVTGGMTTMSVSAFSMAEELKVDTQYIKSAYDGTKALGPESGVLIKKYPDE